MGNKLGAFLAGGLVGAAAALLLAPRTGQEARALVADKVNVAWGGAQEFGSQASANVQQAYQTATERGQEVVNAAAARGQHIAQGAQEKGRQAAGRVQEAVSGVRPSFSQDTDELRDKIEAARQRIAAQVAQNAAAATETIDAKAEGAADAVEDAVEGAADAVKDAADKIDAE